MLKKTLGLALAALLVVAIALWNTIGRIEPAIKSAIETEGALATRTQVLVGGVEFSPFTGAGALDGLTVGNPTGFSSPYAVVVDRIALQVQSRSLLGSGPVVVDSATVFGPHITYKAASPAAISNLETINSTAQAYSGTPSATRAGSDGRKMIIRDLTVMAGTLSLDMPLPGGALTVALPPLHLTNIGATTNGATPPEIIRAVCEALADEAKKTVTQVIAEKVEAVLAAPKPPLRELLRALPRPPAPPKPPVLPLPSLPSLPSPPQLRLPSPPPPPGSSSSSSSSSSSTSSPPALPPLPSPPRGLGLPPPPPGF
jgi:hypothetical protein